MEHQEIYTRLKNMIQKYAPPLSVKTETNDRYELYTKKNVELNGKKYDEFFFGSIILKSQYIGFYFMPIYIYPELLIDVPETLKKLQTGKSCFHIKKYEQSIFNAISDLIETGFDAYRKNNLI
ncbi:MAG TPA: hypothetical protein PKW80_14200 [Bacteroidales bacterium]|nr:hypothetical protein [Bacteroidales bacterium]